MIFNIFINDLFVLINGSKATNFVDDNTIYASRKDLKDLPETLEKKFETSMWSRGSDISVNTDKFQSMLMGTEINSQIYKKQ